MEREKLKTIVKICKLYYLEGYSQQELSNMFGISRPQISRIINSAREKGIVEIKINDPFNEELYCEQKLKNTYDLHDAVVVDTSNMSKDESIELLAKSGGYFLEKIIQSDSVIGLMAGKFIHKLVQYTKKTKAKNVRVIPLVGGLGISGASWHANSNVIQLAEKMNFDYYVLNAPAIVSSNSIKSDLIREEGIRQVLDFYSRLNIAVVGIGEITEEATFFKTMNLSKKELDEILDAGAVCTIGKSFLNEKGEEVAQSITSRMIGVSGEHLRQTPLVIGIAAGDHKVEAISASLAGKWLDVLITDVNTSKKLLEEEKIK